MFDAAAEPRVGRFRETSPPVNAAAAVLLADDTATDAAAFDKELEGDAPLIGAAVDDGEPEENCGFFGGWPTAPPRGGPANSTCQQIRGKRWGKCVRKAIRLVVNRGYLVAA